MKTSHPGKPQIHQFGYNWAKICFITPPVNCSSADLLVLFVTLVLGREMLAVKIEKKDKKAQILEEAATVNIAVYPSSIVAC